MLPLFALNIKKFCPSSKEGLKNKSRCLLKRKKGGWGCILTRVDRRTPHPSPPPIPSTLATLATVLSFGGFIFLYQKEYKTTETELWQTHFFKYVRTTRLIWFGVSKFTHTAHIYQHKFSASPNDHTKTLSAECTNITHAII